MIVTNASLYFIYNEKVLRDKIFISYSHKNKRWLEEIKKELSVCKVAILLLSTNFLASDFIQTNELPPLLEAAEIKGITILPLLVKPCRFNKKKELSKFQAIINPDKAVSKLSENKQDEILLKLVDSTNDLLIGSKSES